MSSKDEFDALLNASTPLAPKDGDEVRARLRSVVNAPLTSAFPVAPEQVLEQPPAGRSRRSAKKEAAELRAGLAEIRESMRELDGLAAAVESANPGPVTGADETGTVHATVGSDDGLESLEISRSWRKKVGIQGLAPAVLAAVQAAFTERVTVWARALDAPAEPREPAREEEPPGPRLDREAAVRMFLQLTDEYEHRSERLRQEQEQTPRERTFSDGPGHVRVRTTDGGLSGLTLSERWLSTATAEMIGPAVLDVLRQALAAGVPAGATELQETSRGLQDLLRAMQGS